MLDTSFGLPCPAIVYAHNLAPTTLMGGLAEAKSIRQTHLSRTALVFKREGFREED
jgi:hypothetical protein